jgi:protein phosphatase
MSAVWTDRSSGVIARAGAASHVGYFRENNEDLVYIDPTDPFALVLDGMGGQAAGEVASRRGADAVRAALHQGFTRAEEPRALIQRALRAGNAAVLEIGTLDPALQYCGTTIVLALLHGGTAYVSWLGDSRAYRISGERIEQLTWDHNLTSALVHHGVISAEEARHHRTNHALWRYFGTKDAEGALEIPLFAPANGDRLLLATDGVTGVLSEADLLQLGRAHPDPCTCAAELVKTALERGSRDNCTCAVIAFEREGEAPPAQPPVRKWWQFWK